MGIAAGRGWGQRRARVQHPKAASTVQQTAIREIELHAVTAPRIPRMPPARKAASPKPVSRATRKAWVSTEHSPYYQIWVLTNLTARPFAALFGTRFHLNLTEWRVLLTVADRPGISAQELADYTGLDKMNVSRIVRHLEAQGRLVREGSTSDRRRRHLDLTEQGWSVYDEIARSAVRRERQIYAGLSASELATLRVLLSKLSARAREDVLTAETSEVDAPAAARRP